MNNSLLRTGGAPPAYVTVVHNGVLVQNNVEIAGPVSFRNIWIREI